MTYLVRFDEFFPEPVFAGLHKGALGFAHGPEGAIHFPDKETAGRHAANGYGLTAMQHAVIVPATDPYTTDVQGPTEGI